MVEVLVYVIPPKNWYGHIVFRTAEDLTLGDVCVPKGYKSDGATIPRWFTALGIVLALVGMFFGYYHTVIAGLMVALIPVVFPKANTYLPAAIVHDYCLTNTKYTRRQCDKIFLKCLETLGVAKWRRYAMYFGVSLWSTFKS